jgi:LPXTG-motif cell wall-anchored protein
MLAQSIVGDTGDVMALFGGLLMLLLAGVLWRQRRGNLTALGRLRMARWTARWSVYGGVAFLGCLGTIAVVVGITEMLS